MSPHSYRLWYVTLPLISPVIELVHSQPSVVQSFQKSIQNGKINMREILDNDKTLEAYQNEGIYNDPTEVVIQKSDIDFAVPFRLQFTILLKRMLLQGRRNNTGMYIQFFHHLLSALIVGGIFYGTGNDASQTIATFKYCVCINVFFMYTHVMLPVLLCKSVATFLSKFMTPFRSSVRGEDDEAGVLQQVVQSQGVLFGVDGHHAATSGKYQDFRIDSLKRDKSNCRSSWG